MPANTVTVSQVNDPQYFNFTHYIAEKRSNGTWYWVLTGKLFGVPFTIPNGQTTRKDKVLIYLTLPEIGNQWVRLTQWAPYVEGSCLQAYQVLQPLDLMSMLVIECDCEAQVTYLERPGPWGDPIPVPTAVLSFGWVVHLIGTLENPPYP